MVAGTLAAAACGLLAGSNAWISFVEYPSMLEAGPDLSFRYFGSMAPRAAKLNTSLVLLATTLALAHAYYMPTRGHLMNNAAWWISALLVALLLPYTYVAMSRSTGVLLKAAKEAPPTATAPPAGPDVPGAAGGIPAQRALRIWGDLHVVRTLTSTASFTIMLWGLASSTV